MTKRKYPKLNEGDDRRRKIPTAEYQTIRNMKDDGKSLSLIAYIYGVSKTTIRNIVNPDGVSQSKHKPNVIKKRQANERYRRRKRKLQADELRRYYRGKRTN